MKKIWPGCYDPRFIVPPEPIHCPFEAQANSYQSSYYICSCILHKESMVGELGFHKEVQTFPNLLRSPSSNPPNPRSRMSYSVCMGQLGCRDNFSTWKQSFFHVWIPEVSGPGYWDQGLEMQLSSWTFISSLTLFFIPLGWTTICCYSGRVTFLDH